MNHISYDESYSSFDHLGCSHMHVISGQDCFECSDELMHQKFKVVQLFKTYLKIPAISLFLNTDTFIFTN